MRDLAYPEVDVSVVIVTAEDVGVVFPALAVLLVIQLVSRMARVNLQGQILRKTLENLGMETKEMRTEKDRRTREMAGNNLGIWLVQEKLSFFLVHGFFTWTKQPYPAIYLEIF